jgi:CYTH domain-containing protein
MSKWQQEEAAKIRKLDRDEFEAAIESDEPRERLAALLAKPKPEGFSKATSLIGELRELAKFCGSNDPVTVAKALSDGESVQVRGWLSEIDQWFHTFIQTLEEK